MNLDFCFVINLFIQLVSSSPLIVIRNEVHTSHPIIANDKIEHSYQLLECISERPNDAVVWNTNLQLYKNHFGNFKRREWKEPPPLSYSISYTQQCRINVDNEDCFSIWSQINGSWSVVHSYDVPMGPVYDSRWEEMEISNDKPITRTKNGSILEFRETGSIVFSIRGKDNAQIIICKSHELKNDPCYVTIIGDLMNKISGIGKCKGEIKPFATYYNFPCYPLRGDRKIEHVPSLNSSEWRTFVLTWEEKTRTLELFNPDKKLLSYSDHSYKYNSKNNNSKNIYSILVRSPSKNMLFRFHNYSYTMTKDRHAILQSSQLTLENYDEMCVDMVVGLCKHCELIVSIVDGSGKKQATKRIRRSSKYNSVEHDLPMWQNEIIKAMSISSFRPPITLELITSVISNESDHRKDHWAIANFQYCVPEGTIQITKMITYNDYKTVNRSEYYNLCQRLSYDDSKSEVVNTLHEFSATSHNLTSCPNCATICNKFFFKNCMSRDLCTKDGCSCAPGWHRSIDCNIKCSTGLYGFDCSEKCSNCTNDNCDSFTGKCNQGCKTAVSKYLVPPYCNIVINPPLAPFVDELNSTSARVFIYEEKIYTTFNVTFEFELKTKSGNFLIKHAQKGTVSINGTESTIYYITFSELAPGEEYSVTAIIRIYFEDNKIRQIVGNSATFMTLCSSSKEFQITPIKGYVIIQKIPEEEIYPCPDSWYLIDLSIISTIANKSYPVNMNNTVIKFPITLSRLDPYEIYQICINGSDNKFHLCLLSINVETVPQPVTNLQVKSTTATEAELTWRSPELLNDILREYRLTIKVLYYLGCENKENTPENLKITKIYDKINPTARVSYNLKDLMPYVTYEATVVAVTKKISKEKKLIFSTKPRDIPTEVFSNISFSHNNLTWNNQVDCWAITGLIKGSRVIVTGVSEDVKNYSYSYDTRSSFLNLKTLQIYGNEKYQAKVYVLHESINTTAYIDIFFTTDLSFPPQDPDTTIVEVDELSTTLRWQQSLSPIVNKKDSYSIRFLRTNGTLLNEVKVNSNETCYFWKNSFCKIFSYSSNDVVGTYIKGVNDSVPEIPEIISIAEVDIGVIYLKWKHLSIIDVPIKKFIIFSRIFNTELEHIPSQSVFSTKEVPIHKYKSEYSTYLYLLPSTRYGIFIQGVSLMQSGKLSTQIIETNSFRSFQYQPHPVLDNNTFLINIVIPPVINNTKNSRLHIIVKGPSMCVAGGRLSEQMIKDIQIKYPEEAWRVATFPTYQTANMSFTIGDDRIYDTVSNCPLNAGSSYVIILLVWETINRNMNKTGQSLIWQSESIQVGEAPKVHHELWAIPLILAFLLIAVTVCYCSRRRWNRKHFNKMRRDEIAQSIPAHSIITKKSSQLSNSSELTAKTTITENVYEEILDTIDAQESISKILSNPSECINENVTSQPTYLEIIDS